MKTPSGFWVETHGALTALQAVLVAVLQRQSQLIYVLWRLEVMVEDHFEYPPTYVAYMQSNLLKGEYRDTLDWAAPQDPISSPNRVR